MLQRVMLRRCKTDVLKDLPAKTYRDFSADIDAATMKVCDEAVAEIRAKVRGQEVAKAKKAGKVEITPEELDAAVEHAILNLTTSGLSFRQLEAARTALATAKIPTMLEVVETYEQQNEPLVVFSAHRAPIDVLQKREGWATITGDTSEVRRTQIVKDFQDGRLKGVGLTVRAGGVSITLTRASNVLQVDQEWNPSLNVQAHDRCYRIGQRNAVLVTRLVANHILDERISAVISKKELFIAGSVQAASVTRVEAPVVVPVVIDWAAIELAAAAAMREASEALKALAGAKSEHARKLAQLRIERATDEARSRVRAAAARRLEEDETEIDAPRRGPADVVEEWALQGLQQLADADPDRAQTLNNVGFSKSDGGIGHALAWLEELTEQEWRLAIRIARVYHRQIGKAPELDGGVK